MKQMSSRMLSNFNKIISYENRSTRFFSRSGIHPVDFIRYRDENTEM